MNRRDETVAERVARIERERRARYAGPYIRWVDYGVEGYKPDSFPTLKAALLDREHYGQAFVITKLVDFEVEEKMEKSDLAEATTILAREGARLSRQLAKALAALKFIHDLAEEELPHARVGTGAEVVLRHIVRRSSTELRDAENDKNTESIPNARASGSAGGDPVPEQPAPGSGADGPQGESPAGEGGQ